MSLRSVGTAMCGVTLLVLLSGCATAPAAPAAYEAYKAAPAETSTVAGWTQTADFPLAPRDLPVTVWTGEELLVLGGYTGPPCPPTADCAPGEWAPDGAALDPVTGEWRVLAADVPQHIASAAFLGGRAYFNASTESDGAVLVYDVASDSWQSLPGVPDVRGTRLVVDGGRILFVSETDEFADLFGTPRVDQAFTPATGEWAPLPDDPFGPSYGRSAVSTPYGVVLFSTAIASVHTADPGFADVALLAPGSEEWQSLGRTGSMLSGGFLWTGEKLVDPSLGGSDGGETDGYGRIVPFGGAITLPDGEWHELEGEPQVDPSQDGGGWLWGAAGERFVVTASHLYDAASDTWSELPSPEGLPQMLGTVAWAGDTLVVLGGTDWPTATEAVRSPKVWLYAAGS